MAVLITYAIVMVMLIGAIMYLSYQDLKHDQ